MAAVTVRHSEFGASIGVPLSKITTLGCIQGCVWREIIPYDLLLERRRFIPPNNEQANRIREFCALNKRIKNKMAEFWVMSDPVFFFAESYFDHSCSHLPNEAVENVVEGLHEDNFGGWKCHSQARDRSIQRDCEGRLLFMALTVYPKQLFLQLQPEGYRHYMCFIAQCQATEGSKVDRRVGLHLPTSFSIFLSISASAVFISIAMSK